MRTRTTIICAALAALLAPATASASTVVIWPVDPVLKPGEQATSLWLENNGSETVTLQVRSFGWSQPDGDDRLTEQDQIVASPPIATVAPGRRQLIRVLRRPSAAVVPEGSYRLLIDELPAAPAAGGSDRLNARLAVQMRYSIPLFAYGADPAAQAPRLVTRYIAGSHGPEVEIHNAGAGHARLTDLRLVSHGKETSVKAGLTGYVLPGATVRYSLPVGSLGAVKVGVNGRDQFLTPDA